MRVDRKTLAAHRAAIVDQAGQLFRRRGITDVGVADITRAAGLTHGAFYGHFPSKSALAAESCLRALLDGAARWRGRADRARAEGREPLEAIIDYYLSEAHRDAADGGCVLASLGSEVVRDPDLRAALDHGARALAEVLEQELATRHPGRAPAVHAAAALAILSALNGGLLLARAAADDPERSRAVMASAAALARHAAA